MVRNERSAFREGTMRLTEHIDELGDHSERLHHDQEKSGARSDLASGKKRITSCQRGQYQGRRDKKDSACEQPYSDSLLDLKGR